MLVHHCKTRLSIFTNGKLPSENPTSLDTDTQADLAEAELEVGVAPGPGEEEKALIREEFERGLQEQGLEIERDVEVRMIMCRCVFSMLQIHSRTRAV